MSKNSLRIGRARHLDEQIDSTCFKVANISFLKFPLRVWSPISSWIFKVSLAIKIGGRFPLTKRFKMALLKQLSHLTSYPSYPYNFRRFWEHIFKSCLKLIITSSYNWVTTAEVEMILNSATPHLLLSVLFFCKAWSKLNLSDLGTSKLESASFQESSY